MEQKNKLNLIDIQNEGLNILKSFKNLCEENNLNYYLAYGTLLGAVRHSGFIPWDDDIDIMMPRHDYENLKLLLTKSSSFESLRWHDIETHTEYPYLIARIDNGKTRIHRADERMNEIGIFIDVYPLDYLSDNYADACRQVSILGLLSSLYFASTRTKFEPYCQKRIIKYFYVIVARTITTVAVRSILWFLLRHWTYDYVTKYIGPATWMTLKAKRNIFESQWFQYGTSLEFEGEDFSVPCDYDSILKTYYGEYMTLPPQRLRQPHHEYQAFYK